MSEPNSEPRPDSKSTGDIGRSNRSIAWSSIAVGVGVGLLIGLWSFNGPAAVPEWLGAYDDVSRRLARLGHIAFIGLGILNLLMVREIECWQERHRVRRFALAWMNLGNVFLPLLLWAAAMYHPIKYAMSVPATCVFMAITLSTYGVCSKAAR